LINEYPQLEEEMILPEKKYPLRLGHRKTEGRMAEYVVSRLLTFSNLKKEEYVTYQTEEMQYKQKPVCLLDAGL
jgi:hypothetical protein